MSANPVTEHTVQHDRPRSDRACVEQGEGAFGPLSHLHYRANRGSSARYVLWGAPWMLDPAMIMLGRGASEVPMIMA